MSSSGAAPAKQTELTPVAPQERIQLLDVLRGFCLFGVLWSNLNDHYGTPDPATRLDEALQWVQYWLIEERFYSLLGFLFGIGFAIQFIRAQARAVDVRPMFYRRMAALLALGMVHGLLIWHGDILTTYALLGFVLVLFRRLSPRRLLLAAIAVSLAVPYLIVRIGALLHLHWSLFPFEEANWIYANGTWPQIFLQNIRQYLWWHGRWPLFIYPSFLALFMLGLCAMRLDLLPRLARNRAALWWTLVGTVICWGAASLALAAMPRWSPLSPPSEKWNDALFWIPHDTAFRSIVALATWANSATYALLFAVALSFPAGARRLQPLAALGRMTLTTYLAQSLFCTTLFYHWGFGWFGKVRYTGMLAITVALFSAQVVFSVWWLRHYRFGPAEWLWRSLAYGKPQPMRLPKI